MLGVQRFERSVVASRAPRMQGMQGGLGHHNIQPYLAYSLYHLVFHQNSSSYLTEPRLVYLWRRMLPIYTSSEAIAASLRLEERFLMELKWLNAAEARTELAIEPPCCTVLANTKVTTALLIPILNYAWAIWARETGPVRLRCPCLTATGSSTD